MQKGEIYYSRQLGHPFIFFENTDEQDDQFLACMVTHSTKISENIKMDPLHFKVNDSEGNLFKFQYHKTHLTKRKLIKTIDLGEFKKVGELTDEGILFVEKHIRKLKE
jgi:hypothetical protein